MKLLKRLFGKSNSPGAPSGAKENMLSAREAIQQARKGRISINEMLAFLAESDLFIPLAEPPQMEDAVIKSWKPCTVSKADGSQWLVAFTSPEPLSEFSKHTPGFSFGISAGTKWVLQLIPPQHGIAFNIGTEDMFEWNADGLAQYRAEMLPSGAT